MWKYIVIWSSSSENNWKESKQYFSGSPSLLPTTHTKLKVMSRDPMFPSSNPSPSLIHSAYCILHLDEHYDDVCQDFFFSSLNFLRWELTPTIKVRRILQGLANPAWGPSPATTLPACVVCGGFGTVKAMWRNWGRDLVAHKAENILPFTSFLCDRYYLSR